MRPQHGFIGKWALKRCPTMPSARRKDPERERGYHAEQQELVRRSQREPRPYHPRVSPRQEVRSRRTHVVHRAPRHLVPKQHLPAKMAPLVNARAAIKKDRESNASRRHAVGQRQAVRLYANDPEVRLRALERDESAHDKPHEQER